MGQMTYAVVYGVDMEAPDSIDDEEGWHGLISHYGDWDTRRKAAGPDTASGDGRDSFAGVGFWCAVGASGKDGVPDLEGFPLDDFAGASKEHKAALAKAKKGWEAFAEWCATPHSGGKGDRAWKTPAIELPAPRLYLVSTEVA